MKKIMISIKPQYVEQILLGNKKYEYRKSRCHQEVSSMIIYSTFPVKKVVAEVEIKGIFVDSPCNIWESTKQGAGIEKKQFDSYFYNSVYAVAYRLGKIKRFNPPRSLSDYGIGAAPQSYQYVIE